MELTLSNSQEARLIEIARHEGKNVGDLLVETATTLLRTEDQRWAEIEDAIAQANRGELLDEEDMDRRIATMLAR